MKLVTVLLEDGDPTDFVPAGKLHTIEQVKRSEIEDRERAAVLGAMVVSRIRRGLQQQGGG
jgi:hypothetical protein